MKLVHISDLHLGKRVNEFSMIEDQKYILLQILRIIDEEKADGLLIAGDVYDKSVPADEAMALMDDFLGRLAQRDIQVFIISGNHDSAVKLSYAADLIKYCGIHLSPVYDGNVTPIELKKGDETVNIFMLPFIKPATVKSVFRDEADSIHNYTDACRVAVSHMDIDTGACNILLAHQFVLGAVKSESEEISIGGLDQVDASVFDAFDYVALGHIHGPQTVGRETVRYCGTPLKYSFSEAKHIKSVTIIDIPDSHDINIRTIPLVPLHDLREIKGEFAKITDKSFYQESPNDDYLHIILTDEDDIPDAIGKLRRIYPNLMKLSYDNKRTRANGIVDGGAATEQKSEIQLFEELYEKQNNQLFSDEQREFLTQLIEGLKP